MEPSGAELPTLEASEEAFRGVTPGDLGIVMGGGGARAAYQVGVLRCVARCFPELFPPYIHGVSAGAINATHLASHHGNFVQSVDELTHLWANLTVNQVFRADSLSLFGSLLRWTMQLLSGGRLGTPSRGMVDTEPLRRYLSEALHTVDGEVTGVRYNCTRGRLKALALSTASYTTGRSITWVQGEGIEEWERPQRGSRNTVITVDHVMASTALPLFFPAVRLGEAWYGDGGVRLTAPLSPILHMGARKVLAISTRYDRDEPEARHHSVEGYPPPAQVVGVLMNAIFLDLLDADALRLERLNQLLEHLPPEKRHGLKEVDLMILRPSTDLGRLASRFEPRLPPAFRFLSRGWGTRETESPDFLSLILFQPDYLQALIEMGEKDAMERRDEIFAFLNGTGQGAGDGPPAGSGRGAPPPD